MNRTPALACVTVLLSMFATVDEARAQYLGTFTWQLAPSCNVVTLSVTQQGPVFALSGFDDGCGSDPRSAVNGSASLEGSTVLMGFNTIAPNGVAVNTRAQLTLPSVSGTWTDSGGGSGTFAFAPSLPTTGQPRAAESEAPFAYGQIREDGSIRSGSKRLVSATNPETGVYCLTFSPAPTQDRAESAVIGASGGGDAVFVARNTNGQGSPGAACPSGSHLRVRALSAAGVPTSARFTFILP